jgi:SAM-dependent methyltransferase
MKTNRLLTRREAEKLGLQSRITLEKKITDAEAEEIKAKPVPPNWRFDDYRNHSPERRYEFDYLGPLAGKTILDLGCGYHPTPTYFALAGARKVYACDVSPNAVAFARKTAAAAGVADRVSAFVCAGEQLPLASETVDLVHGEALLHHLLLPQAGIEIARVMKNGARAAFKDPLGHNLLLEFARDYLPYAWKKTHKGTDRPLKFHDIELFGRHFSRYTYKGFGLFSMIVLAVQKGKKKTAFREFADRLDARVLQWAPWLHRYARVVVTCAEKRPTGFPTNDGGKERPTS